MTPYYVKVTEEQLNELLAEDLSLAASLAKLINEGGDIRAFLFKKIEEREEELARFHLSQDTRWMDKEELKRDPSVRDTLAYARSLGLQVW